jgi:hypothetical protein
VAAHSFGRERRLWPVCSFICSLYGLKRLSAALPSGSRHATRDARARRARVQTCSAGVVQTPLQKTTKWYDRTTSDEAPLVLVE